MKNQSDGRMESAKALRAPAPREPRMRLITAACAAAIVTCGLAAYSNSLRGPFVFDDLSSIVENPSIRSLWPIWPVFSPTGHGSTVQGRPLVNLSLAINYAVGGTDNVVGYHVVNMILHMLAGLTLFGVFRRTLVLPSMPDKVRHASTWLALGAALLWLVHPLQTSAVTYVIQRAGVMMGLFYLLTLYCFIRGDDSLKSRGWWYQARADVESGLKLGVKFRENFLEALYGTRPLPKPQPPIR